jgi:uncharacterized Zn finger protein
MKPLLTLNLEEITSSTKEKAEALFKTEFAVTATSEIRKYFGIVRCQDPKDRNKIITIKGSCSAWHASQSLRSSSPD